jgi:hypothetical protein
MRKIVIIGMMVLGISSCSETVESSENNSVSAPIPDDNTMKFQYGNVDEYRIQEIDGCEYIILNGQTNSDPTITHKGNCKYCLERNKQEESLY